ncbi:MAG: hypothetical protein ACTSUE_08635 [Promethearchaeota archaeon]
MKTVKQAILAILACVMVVLMVPLTHGFLTRSNRAAAGIGTVQSTTINIAVLAENVSATHLQNYKIALELDPSYNTTYFSSTNLSGFSIPDPLSTSQEFDVIFLLDFTRGMNFTADQVQNITDAVQGGNIGLFYQTNNDDQEYNTTHLAILDDVLPLRPTLDGSFPQEIDKNLTTSISTSISGSNDILLDRVGFISMPLLLNLTLTEANHSSAKVLVDGALGLTPGSTTYPLLARIDDASTRVIQLAAPLREDSNENLGNWPWFNYLCYAMIMNLSGQPDSSIKFFANWEYSPIPQGWSQLFVILLLVAFFVVTLVMFTYFKRKSRNKPLVLKTMEEFVAESKRREERILRRKQRMNLFKKKSKELAGSTPESTKSGAGTSVEEVILDVTEKSWKVPGYHKPLSGFFTMFFITLVVIAPLFVVVIYVLPTFIIQDPSSFGIQFIISSIFSAVFITLDFGLAQAYDRFVGQYWSTDPKKALKYIQFFIWYQTISGLAQTTIISLIGLFLVPRVNSVAFMSWFFVVNTLVQFPGIVYVFTHLLKSAQRTDLEALVNFISLIFFQIGLMAVFPELFRNLGARNPLIGEVIGSSLGLSLGGYAAQLAQMFLSAAFISKVDKRFVASQIFRIDFDRELVKETIIFGLKSMLSNVIYLFGNFFAVFIITFKLNNYTYYGSFIGIATYLTFPILFMTTLYENALPSTSEAYNNKKFKLTESFITYGFKYFGMFALLLFTLFVMPYSVNRIVTSVVPELYKPMGFVIMAYSITRLFLALGDYSKLFLISIDRAGTYIYAVLIEQVIRITFLFLAIDSLGFFAYLFAEIPGAMVKIIITWVLTHKKIIPVRINLWQTIVAPGISCLILAGLGWVMSLFYDAVIAAITPVGGATLYMVIYFIGFGIFLYPFLLGILGGHDGEVLDQMKFAAQKSGPSRPFALIFYKITLKACMISRLHDRFKIDFDEARNEIRELLEITSGN